MNLIQITMYVYLHTNYEAFWRSTIQIFENYFCTWYISITLKWEIYCTNGKSYFWYLLKVLQKESNAPTRTTYVYERRITKSNQLYYIEIHRNGHSFLSSSFVFNNACDFGCYTITLDVLSQLLATDTCALSFHASRIELWWWWWWLLLMMIVMCIAIEGNVSGRYWHN